MVRPEPPLLSTAEGGAEAGGLGGVDEVGDGDHVVIDVDLGAAVLAAGDGTEDAGLGAECGLEALLVVGTLKSVDLEEDGRHLAHLWTTPSAPR